MLNETQLRIVGLDEQPDEVSAYRIGALLDLHSGSTQRVMAILARESLEDIGLRLGQPGSDVSKLVCESYFWARVPELFLILAQKIASGAAPLEDTRVDD